MKRFIAFLVVVVMSAIAFKGVAQSVERSRVALLNIQTSGVALDEGTVAVAREMMSAAIINTGTYSIVDNEKISNDPTVSALMSVEQLASLGKAAEVSKVVFPSIKKAGDKLVFTIKLFDVAASIVERQKVKLVAQDDILSVAETLTQELVAVAKVAVAQPAAQVQASTGATVAASAPSAPQGYTPTGGVIMYGVDYSKAQIRGTKNTREEYVDALKKVNALFNAEPEKFNFTDFSRRQVVNHTSVSDKWADKLDWDYAMQAGLEPKKHSVAEMVKSYQLPHADGIGMVVIAWLLDEAKAVGHYEVVYFDIATRRILLNTSVTAPAGGSKLRNFWANSIYEVIVQKELRKYVKQILSTYRL